MQARRHRHRTTDGGEPRPLTRGPWALAPRVAWLLAVFRLARGSTGGSGPAAGNVRARVLRRAVLGTRGCSTALFGVCFGGSGEIKY